MLRREGMRKSREWSTGKLPQNEVYVDLERQGCGGARLVSQTERGFRRVVDPACLARGVCRTKGVPPELRCRGGEALRALRLAGGLPDRTLTVGLLARIRRIDSQLEAEMGSLRVMIACLRACMN